MHSSSPVSKASSGPSTGGAESPVPREVVLTGDRPTGPLHLGHFAGSLRTRLALQFTTTRPFLSPIFRP